MASIAPDIESSRMRRGWRNLPSHWQKSLLQLGIAVFAIFVIFWRDWADIGRIAWNISTYNHILLVVPILVWLVAQRIPLLLKLRPRIWFPGLAVLLAAGICWILGQVAGLSIARHLAVILMLQGSIITILGPAVSRGLAFPLFYAFFLLPIGEEAVPLLQTVTADISMVLLAISGIPAHIEGVFITTPTGYFEVAEACSGIKFLIAMIAFGALVANVCFKTWGRRIAFMVASIVIPILANGIRAWGTMYIAHFQGIEFAAGFDHILYGWIFFAVVLALVMGIGWRFFDRSLDDPAFDIDAAKSYEKESAASGGRFIWIAALALIAMPMLWSAISVPRPAPMPEAIDLPQVPGWKRIGYEPDFAWQPRFDGANHLLFGTYANDRGDKVEVGFALYDTQGEGREITGYGQGAHDPASQWAWTATGDSVSQGKSDIFIAPGPVTREALTFYRIGDVMTGSASRVKLEIMKARLTGASQPAMTLIISAENRDGRTGRAAINAFLDDIGSPDKLADQIAGMR